MEDSGLHSHGSVYLIVHTRETGTKQIYQVVEETVLSDATGLHLDAGPYMLIYSRAVQDPHDFCSYWPTALKVCRYHFPLETPDGPFIFRNPQR